MIDLAGMELESCGCCGVVLDLSCMKKQDTSKLKKEGQIESWVSNMAKFYECPCCKSVFSPDEDKTWYCGP